MWSHLCLLLYCRICLFIKASDPRNGSFLDEDPFVRGRYLYLVLIGTTSARAAKEYDPENQYFHVLATSNKSITSCSGTHPED